MTLQLETSIPLLQVAKKYGVPPEALTRLARDGIIRLSRTQKGDSVIAVSTSTVAAAANVILDEIHPEQYEHLRGNRVRLTKASEEYDVPNPNLSRWIDLGYLQAIRKSRVETYLDRADIEYVIDVFKKAQKLTGSSIKAGWVLKKVLQRSANSL